MLNGSIVAIVTPMHEDGSLDLKRFGELIDWHVSEGTRGIVVVGTTGESPTVDFDDHCSLINAAVERTAGRIPVIAGTGANSTTEAIELASFAKTAGADMSLTVVPYYNKPTQEGLYRHFRAIAEAVDMPHILYNVPGRTVADLHNDTTLRLSQIANSVGIKDATASIERGADLLKRVPKDFAVYSGDDASSMALMMMGGHGVISVTANVAPALVQEVCASVLAGDFDNAREANNKLLALNTHLFVEANPITVKWVLQEMGKIEPGIRLPLTPLSSSFHDLLRGAMQQAGITIQSAAVHQ
jgi:4-hydroxy-tetrahydrodipicolinate synthase